MFTFHSSNFKLNSGDLQHKIGHSAGPQSDDDEYGEDDYPDEQDLDFNEIHGFRIIDDLRDWEREDGLEY